MNNAVIDASALLALLNSEPGADQVAAALGHASISAVNLCETITKLTDAGVPPEEAGAVLAPLGLEVLDFRVGHGALAAGHEEQRTVSG